MTIEPSTTSPTREPEVQSGATKRTFVFKLVRLAIFLVVVFAVGLAVQRSIAHWNAQSAEERIEWRQLHKGWLGVAAVTYALGLLPAAMVLAQALKALQIHVAVSWVTAAQLLGHLGKYVPGKAMVVVLRAAVLSQSGQKVGVRAATLAVTIETLTVVASGAAIALLLIQFLDTPRWIQRLGSVGALSSLLITWPPLLRGIVSRKLISGHLSFFWGSREMLISWFWNVIAWTLFAASLTAVTLALPDQVRTHAYQSSGILFLACMSAYALAMVAGFLSFLPGGAGAREVVLITLLTPAVGPSGALISAIALRLLQILVEVLVAMGVYVWMRQQRGLLSETIRSS